MQNLSILPFNTAYSRKACTNPDQYYDYSAPLQIIFLTQAMSTNPPLSFPCIDKLASRIQSLDSDPDEPSYDNYEIFNRFY
ncbi:hypothetical protein BC941DRAFT_476429 [Chlamydoabsidia padenii]|nr:hypothetical protein BC941DRAFT_476429 [Chlamydoabsidia padenii]